MDGIKKIATYLKYVCSMNEYVKSWWETLGNPSGQIIKQDVNISSSVNLYMQNAIIVRKFLQKSSSDNEFLLKRAHQSYIVYRQQQSCTAAKTFYYKPIRDGLRVEEARDGKEEAGDPNETDGDPGDALAHPRPERMNDGDVPFILIIVREWILF